MDVGIRELKANLSKYLSLAAVGEEVVVTDRNRPVARIVAYSAASEVDRGIDEGWIEAPRRTLLGEVEPIRSSQATLDVLAEDRQ